MRTINGKQYVEKAPHDMTELREIIAVLRSPEGCPWDREQTYESLKKCLTDETGEVLEAVDNEDYENLCEELGDVLLQVLLYSQMAEEAGHFTLDDVIQGLSEKMIRRHPHVFGDEPMPETAEGTLALWEQIKKQEERS